VNMITYDEYLEALVKVKSFRYQLENEAAESYIKASPDPIPDIGIVGLLQEKASARLIYGIKYFLKLETAYAKIPYATAEAVPISFFVEHYTLKHLRLLRNMGTGSLILLNKILLDAGHNGLKDFKEVKLKGDYCNQ
jgi:hypothetical protein